MIRSEEVLRKLAESERFEVVKTESEDIKIFKLKGTPYEIDLRYIFENKSWFMIHVYNERTSENNHIAEIYAKSNHSHNYGEGNECGLEKFLIQTTSYGSLSVDKVEKVIEGYKMAVDAVNELNKIFGLN